MGLGETISGASTRLASLLAEAGQALRGEGDFGPEQIAALGEPLTEMDPLMGQAPELRRLQPDLSGALDLYKSQLEELQATLERVRVMLLARRASLAASQSQVAAVNQWVERLDQTR